MPKKPPRRPKKLDEMSDAERVAHIDREIKQDKPQKQRFIDFAREHGADETGEALDKAFKSLADRKRD